MAGPALIERLAGHPPEPVTAVCGIVGGSRRHSLAPDVFNTGFRELGLPAAYLSFSPADFGSFWRETMPSLGVPVLGLTVVSPHKEAALAVAATTGGRAERAGAANCLVAVPEGWRAANTSGLLDLLATVQVAPRGLRTAVIGCGGAGRAIAAELGERGAEVTLVNRGAKRGRYASARLGLPWTPLEEFDAEGCDLVVNATPLARDLPFDPARLAPGSVVADLAYIAGTPTALIEAAGRHDLVAIDGRMVLAAETGAQFRLMTGKPLPPDAVKVALG
jgi:3-dehydroquinate dehydratase/shikimate dehydrogenase